MLSCPRVARVQRILHGVALHVLPHMRGARGLRLQPCRVRTVELRPGAVPGAARATDSSCPPAAIHGFRPPRGGTGPLRPITLGQWSLYRAEDTRPWVKTDPSGIPGSHVSGRAAQGLAEKGRPLMLVLGGASHRKQQAQRPLGPSPSPQP